MANNKFKAAVKKAKGLYRSGRYKTFADAVKAAYKKKTTKRRKKVSSVKRTVKRKRRIIRKVRTVKRSNPKRSIEQSLGRAMVEHFKTQSYSRTKQLDKTIRGLKKKLRSL